MITFFEKIINTILPKRDSYICINTISELPILPSSITLQTTKIWYLSDFNLPIVKAAIHEAKFYDTIHAQSLLGKMLRQYLLTDNKKYDVIIPMPLSKARRKKRGYNQIERILKAAGIDNESNILEREDRRAQTSLSKKERLTNVAGAFWVSTQNAPAITGKNILLIDDVVTTGATFQAAHAALAIHIPASITCLALAH